jgi:AraC-like DNA-binding protein
MTVFMRGASLTNYTRVAAELGLDARAMARRVGVDPRILTEPEFRAPAGQVIELLEQSAEASGCETFGLRMAIGRKLSDYGPVSLVMAHQPTARRALEIMIRYQRMLNRALMLQIDDHGDDIVVTQHVLAGDRRRRRQAYELALGSLCATFRFPSGRGVSARMAHFTHAAPKDLAIHRQVFGLAIHFESDFNGVVCRREALEGPIAGANPELARHAEELIESLPLAAGETFADDVAAAIRALSLERASIEAVANRLGATTRTLQRRLSEEGRDFSQLLNEVRRENAMLHLGNPRTSLSEVAELMGYSHATSFARWFAGEFGVTPRAWRASAR